MGHQLLNQAVRRLRRLSETHFAGALTDAELLARVIATGDEAAFETIVWRHGPLVLGVCRRVLRDDHDAEDAFQATFLVLFRKAKSLSKRESLAAWLHQVAFRIALRARKLAERRPTSAPDLEPAAGDPGVSDGLGDLLDREIERLPERWRRVAVLCLLQGKSYAEAADLIGCPIGTVQSRLARARQRLQVRLAKHGILATGGVALLVANDAQAGVASRLVHATLESIAAATGAGGAVSASIATLADGALRSLWLIRLGVWSGRALVACAALTLGGWLIAAAFENPSPPVVRVDVGAVEQRRDLEKDLARLAGEWQLVAAIEDGAAMPADQVKATVFTFLPAGRVSLGPQRVDDHFTLTPDAQPPRIHLTIANAAGDATTRSVGVYELTDGQLRLCLGSDDRPALDFTASKGSGRRLLIFRRPGDEPIKEPRAK